MSFDVWAIYDDVGKMIGFFAKGHVATEHFLKCVEEQYGPLPGTVDKVRHVYCRFVPKPRCRGEMMIVHAEEVGRGVTPITMGILE